MNFRIGSDNLEEVQALLNEGANANARDDSGNTPLHEHAVLDIQYAAEAVRNAKHFVGTKKFVHILLTAGADINAQNSDGNTPLHLAADNNNLSMVQELRKNHLIDVNARNKNGNTPIHLAAHQGNRLIVEVLLEDQLRRIDLSIKNNDGQPAADVAQTEEINKLITKCMQTVSFKKSLDRCTIS